MNSIYFRPSCAASGAAKTLLVALILGIHAQILSATIVADSVADFSGVQGQSNWYYGIYDGHSATPYQQGDFVQLPTYGPGLAGGSYWHETEGPGGYWTAVKPLEQHPNGPVTGEFRNPAVQWAVRRWVSPVAGSVNINGMFHYFGAGIGDGTIDSVVVDGVVLVSHNVRIASPDYDFSVLANLHVGSIVDLTTAPGSSDYTDATNVSVTISTVPEPATFWLATAGFLVLARFRRRWRSGL